MSTQPSSRGNPSTLGTLRMLVRYIGGPALGPPGGPRVSPSRIIAAVAFTALASAAPIFSAFEVMSALSVDGVPGRPASVRCSSSSPELLAGQSRAFDQALELGPHHRWMHALNALRLGKAAISAG